MRPTRSTRMFPVAAVALALLAAVTLGACSQGAEAPVVSFDPASPCTTDGQQPGAYPALEGLLPADWQDQKPDSLDSGRSCTPAALGTLAAAGIDELRFAGSTWKTGSSSGFTMAVFEADGLDAQAMLDFYEDGAKTARMTDEYQRSEVTVGGKPGVRLDVLGSDGTRQSVVAWPGPGDGQVLVLLAANVGDTRTAELLDAFGNR